MGRALKVYGWTGRRREAKGAHHQTREICASPSVAAIRRAFDVRPSDLRDNICETGNDEELRIALAEPGAIFWTELNDYPRSYWRKQNPK